MTKHIRSIIILAMIVVLVWLIFGAYPVNADGNHRNDGDVYVRTGDTIVETGDVNVPVTTGDTNIEGATFKSKAFGLSNNLGDVDIAGCLGSEQWTLLIGGRQKLVINWPCMAEFYLRNGMYDLASMALCNTEILDEFETEDDCEAAHNFGPLPEPTSDVFQDDPFNDEVVETEDDRYDDKLMEQKYAIDTQQKELETVAERVARLEKRPAQVTVEQIGLTDYQISELTKVFSK